MPIKRGENRTERLAVALATLVIATLATGALAHAQGNNGFRLELAFGGARTGSLNAAPGTEAVSVGAPLLGGRVDARLGALLIGLHADCGCDLGHVETFVGGQVGWARRDTPVEVDVSLEGGVHKVSNVGGDFLTTSVGPTVSLPYAGLRLAMAPRLTKLGVAAGLSLFARVDLGSTRASWQIDPFLEPQFTATYDVGGYTAGAALRVIFGT
jgi:hypothetical protein